MPKVKANDLQKAIVTYLNLSGWVAWRQNNGAVYDKKIQGYRKNPQHKKGITDVLGFEKNSAIIAAIEVKVGKDKLSEYQILFLQQVANAGGVAIVARNFDQFMKCFKKQTSPGFKWTKETKKEMFGI